MPFSSDDAARWGARGGAARSQAKKRASRANGKLGGGRGRPPKLPAQPEGIRPPKGSSGGDARHHARQFPEYYAEVAVRLKSSGWPYFTEEEILDALRRMGRYDLVYRRRKQNIKPPSASQKRLIMRMENRVANVSPL